MAPVVPEGLLQRQVDRAVVGLRLPGANDDSVGPRRGRRRGVKIGDHPAEEADGGVSVALQQGAGGRVERVDGVIEQNLDTRWGKSDVLVGAPFRRPDEECAEAAAGVSGVDVALGLDHGVVLVVQGGVAHDVTVRGKDQPGVGVKVERAPVATQLFLWEIGRAELGSGDLGEEGDHRRDVARGRPAE